jgi:hypothetical protein
MTLHYRLTIIDYGRIEDFKFKIIFKGNSIELTVTESTKKINETLIGKALER